jgi:putative two-component system response regulator
VSAAIVPGTELPPAASGSILVVEDEPVVRELLTHWLTVHGYRCWNTETAESAWELLQRHQVHLVTLDIGLPGRSGLELLPDVVARYPDTMIVMLSGEGDTRKAIDAMTHGACGYLIKPVQPEELLLQVRAALQRREFQIEKRNYTRRLEEKVREQTQAIRFAYEETVQRLVRVSHFRDEETGAHIRRTGLSSEVIALAAGWSRPEAEVLRLAAPMHDVGKIGIADAVLRKPGKLTDEEFQKMKQHTVLGARMLAGSQAPLLQMAEKIALCHHERWDGTGYPAGLAAHDIPEAARIVTLADVYDAITHDRVYRPAMAEDEALAVMQRGVGTRFDPGLAGAFFIVLEEIRAIADANPDERDSETLLGEFSPQPEATTSTMPRSPTRIGFLAGQDAESDAAIQRGVR